MAARTLPGEVHTERRIHLERYLQAWLKSHALTMNDLSQAQVWDRLVKTLGADLGTIAGKGVDAVAGYLGMRVAQAATSALGRGLSKLIGGVKG